MADCDHEGDAPFAVVEQNSPQHVFALSPIESETFTPSKTPKSLTKKSNEMGEPQKISSSTPPGLVESMMTEGSNSSAYDSDTIERDALPYLDTSSTFLTSSLHTVASDVGNSSFLPNSRVFGQHEMEFGKSNPGGVSRGSAGFSQLMRAADNANLKLGQSRMQMVPEDEIIELSQQSMPSGTLISAPSVIENERVRTESAWYQNLLSFGGNQKPEPLREPLLPSTPTVIFPLLANTATEASIARAKSAVKSVFEDDQSFEVSMAIADPCTVQDVMEVIGNPNLLKMWCDPIQTLLVTSSSDGTRDLSSVAATEGNRGREYEGEWIEATTTALESPPSNIGMIYSAGLSLLETIGFATYGRITMFVERRRGQVGLTVGPFSGGMYAAHTITVFEEGGHIRIVDRVRLNKEEEEGLSIASMFLCGAFDSCLSSCLLPSIGGYLNQVTTSMARLRILVESSGFSHESEIVSAPR